MISSFSQKISYIVRAVVLLLLVLSVLGCDNENHGDAPTLAGQSEAPALARQKALIEEVTDVVARSRSAGRLSDRNRQRLVEIAMEGGTVADYTLLHMSILSREGLISSALILDVASKIIINADPIHYDPILSSVEGALELRSPADDTDEVYKAALADVSPESLTDVEKDAIDLLLQSPGLYPQTRAARLILANAKSKSGSQPWLSLTISKHIERSQGQQVEYWTFIRDAVAGM